MPRRRIISRIHAIAGTLAFVTILMFLSSSLAAELWGSTDTIVGVKQAIAWALLILVPALITTGASGFAMAGASPKGVPATKLKRMQVIAGNGILVVPWCVFGMEGRAGRVQRGVFTVVQVVEFAAGRSILC